MPFYTSKIINNLAHIVGQGQSDDLNFDFTTGDVTLGILNPSSCLILGPALGTTLTQNAPALSNQIFVSNSSGFAPKSWCAVILDDGTQYFSLVEDVLGPIVTLNRSLPSQASSGNQAVAQSAMEGATDYTVSQDFKFPKSTEIIDRTSVLRTTEIEYNNNLFIPSDSLISDASSYLSTGQSADKFNIVTATGLTYDFVDEDDLAAFTYTVAGYVDNLFKGQNLLLDQIWEADNDQSSMDGIVDSRNTNQPILPDDYLPFVRFSSNQRDTVRIKPPTDTQVSSYQVRDFADTFTAISLEYNNLNNSSSVRSESDLIEIFNTNTVSLNGSNALIETTNTDNEALRLETNSGGQSSIYFGTTNPLDLPQSGDPGDLFIKTSSPADIYCKASGTGSDGWTSLSGNPSRASLRRNSTVGGVSFPLTSTPTAFVSYNQSGPDKGDMISFVGNGILVSNVNDTTNGDVYEVEATITFELTSNDEIIFQIGHDDISGNDLVLTDLQVTRESESNNNFYSCSITGVFNGPSGSDFNPRVFNIYWYSPDNGTIEFHETSFLIKRAG